MRTYEGMFLLDAARAAKDWDETRSLVTNVLERYGAELLLHDRWDERKLAYPIKNQRRGAYYLAYFKASGEAIREIRHDLHLTEGVLRHMILQWDEDKPLPEKIEITRMLTDEELRAGRRGYGGGGGDRDRDRGRGRPRPPREEGSAPAGNAPAAAPATAAPATAAPATAAPATPAPEAAAPAATDGGKA